VNPKKLSLNGHEIEKARVKVDSYVVAGVTDHITPWKSVYQTAKIMGDDTIFILSNSGHLQSLLNPPGNQKASFATGPLEQAGPDAFLAGSKKHAGSWWLHWREWLYERSDDEVPAPAALGNARHCVDVPAPGTYVFDQ
jgi:polyhydroxyalkanoate synthase